MKSVRPQLLLLFFVLLLTPARSWAQASASDRALATELFQRGRAALVDQSYEQACPLLEESQRLDPAGGTLLNLALCHEQIGRTATAWSEFLDALSLARRDNREDRMQYAREHIAALEQRLSRLVVQIALDPALPGLQVERDGTPLGRSVWGVAMPVDPGTHTIQVSATGYEQLTQMVQVKDGADVATVTIAQLTPLAASVAPVESVPSIETPPVASELSAPAKPLTKAEAPEKKSRRKLSTLRRVSLALLGLSLASGVAATVTGVKAIQLRHKAENRCMSGFCSDRARTLNERAMSYADASTGLTVLSGAVGIAGVVLWFAPHSSPNHPALPSGASLMVRGSF